MRAASRTPLEPEDAKLARDLVFLEEGFQALLRLFLYLKKSFNPPHVDAIFIFLLLCNRFGISNIEFNPNQMYLMSCLTQRPVSSPFARWECKTRPKLKLFAIFVPKMGI